MSPISLWNVVRLLPCGEAAGDIFVMEGQATAPDSFALDYHSEQSFSPDDHEGAIEATFQLEAPELEGLMIRFST
ncbi:hypothetical protein IAD21_05711 [Abditibacteriota bacterium]|nr:hypothetical protein IAD21_05711 [Abditibacteriota bacterium]